MSRGQASNIGDTRTSPNGYHYTRTQKGWELTHRILAEEMLGRSLAANERVRFKDLDRKNICKENIEVYVVKERTIRKKIAQLEARRTEIDAELDILREELSA